MSKAIDKRNNYDIQIVQAAATRPSKKYNSLKKNKTPWTLMFQKDYQ